MIIQHFSFMHSMIFLIILLIKTMRTPIKFTGFFINACIHEMVASTNYFLKQHTISGVRKGALCAQPFLGTEERLFQRVFAKNDPLRLPSPRGAMEPVGRLP